MDVHLISRPSSSSPTGRVFLSGVEMVEVDGPSGAVELAPAAKVTCFAREAEVYGTRAGADVMAEHLNSLTGLGMMRWTVVPARLAEAD